MLSSLCSSLYKEWSKSKIHNTTAKLEPGVFSMESQGVLGSSILYLIERLSSLWRLKCTSVEKRPQSVSFKERFFLLC